MALPASILPGVNNEHLTMALSVTTDGPLIDFRGREGTDGLMNRDQGLSEMSDF